MTIKRLKETDISKIESGINMASIKIQGLGELLVASRIRPELTERGIEGIGAALIEIAENLQKLAGKCKPIRRVTLREVPPSQLN